MRSDGWDPAVAVAIVLRMSALVLAMRYARAARWSAAW